MFERPQHRLVLAVLQALRSDVLADYRFLFAGGTRIVLELQEYRVSKDIDFVCSQAEGYAQLRLATSQRSYAALFTPEGQARFQFPREIRVDQYGIHANGSIVLGDPHRIDRLSGMNLLEPKARVSRIISKEPIGLPSLASNVRRQSFQTATKSLRRERSQSSSGSSS